MPGRWGGMPFVALTLCLVAGICLSQLIREYCFAGLAIGALALTGGAALALRRDRRTAAMVLGLSAIASSGLMLALSRRDSFQETDLRALLARGEVSLDALVPFDGCVADDGQKNRDEAVSTIDLRAIRERGYWIPCRGKGTLRIPIGTSTGEDNPAVDLAQGDRVRGWASWHIPRNYQNPGSTDHAGFLRRRGVFLQGRVKSARLLEVVPGDCLDPWTALAAAARQRVRRNLLTLTGADRENQAAILGAVVLGDYSALSMATREAFQNSGTYHVLVVSGLHIAWIAWVLVALFRLLRFHPGAGRLTAAASILFYTSVVGFQASVSRSLWTFLLYLLGQVLFRRAPPANVALASAFLLLAARPDWIFDAGFQLSFLSVLSICLMGAPILDEIVNPAFAPASHSGDPERIFLQRGKVRRLGRGLRTRCELLAEALGDLWHPVCERLFLSLMRTAARCLRAVAGMLTISLCVQLWLEPLLAYHFNRLSWIAPVANLVVVPLSSLVLAAGLLSSLATDVPWIAPMLSASSGWLSTLLLSAARRISGLPGAWQRCPTPGPVWVVASILLIFVWCFMGWRRRWIPWTFTASVLFCLSVGLTPIDALPRPLVSSLGSGSSSGMTPDTVLSLTFLDVGEGDSLVLRFPDSRTWVLDAGGLRQGRSGMEGDHAFDIGEAVVSRYLWSQWITRIERLVLSHPDIDHAGGMPALLKNFSVGRLEYGESPADPVLMQILTTARARLVPQERLQSGNQIVSSGVRVEVVNPPGDGIPRTTNEGSVVLRLTYRQFSALLTGDLEKTGEKDVLERHRDLRGILLKVAHHGSRWATLDPFLERVRPRWAIISVGRSNPFGHPSGEVLSRLRRHGAWYLLTLDQGAITLETDGTRYALSSHVGGLLSSGSLPD